MKIFGIFIMKESVLLLIAGILIYHFQIHWIAWLLLGLITLGSILRFFHYEEVSNMNQETLKSIKDTLYSIKANSNNIEKDINELKNNIYTLKEDVNEIKLGLEEDDDLD